MDWIAVFGFFTFEVGDSVALVSGSTETGGEVELELLGVV